MKKPILYITTILITIFLCITVLGAEGKYFIMLSTGYCPCKICCHPFDTGLTYTGDIAGRGCVAIDPEARILRMGQRLYIENYGYGLANDVGGAIKGWHIDLCFSTHQEALSWGRCLVKVFVIKEAK